MSAFVSKKYSFRKGTVNRGVSAQTVGEFIEDLEKDGHDVTAQSFLDASRPEDAPTHNIFTWDDSVAAEQWRLQESKNILLAIEYDLVVEEEKTLNVDLVETKYKDESPIVRVPAYLNVSPKKFGVKANYKPISEVMKNNEMRNQVLENAMIELNWFKNKYSMLSELSDVFKAIEETQRRLKEGA